MSLMFSAFLRLIRDLKSVLDSRATESLVLCKREDVSDLVSFKDLLHPEMSVAQTV